MIIFDEGDSVIPNGNIKALVHEFHKLHQMPAFFVPTGTVLDLLSNSCLIGWEMLVTDKVVEIVRERNFEKCLED